MLKKNVVCKDLTKCVYCGGEANVLGQFEEPICTKCKESGTKTASAGIDLQNLGSDPVFVSRHGN